MFGTSWASNGAPYDVPMSPSEGDRGEEYANASVIAPVMVLMVAILAPPVGNGKLTGGPEVLVGCSSSVRWGIVSGD